VPAGSPDGGKWTKEPEAGPSSEAPAAPEVTIERQSAGGMQYAALETGTNTDAPSGAPNISVELSPPEHGTNWSKDRYAAITIQRYDRTGNPDIDRNSDILFQTLARYMELMARAEVLFNRVGPALRGTLVHLAFAADVRSQELPGIGRDGVEQSFSAEDLAKYGTDGSIRTDVVMRDVNGHVMAIWDIKTGNAELTDARRREIRREVGVFDDVPLIEIHISRGLTSKFVVA
jgi:hypothetical protein